MGFLQRTQTIGIAAVLIAFSVLLSRVMGLVRDKVISYYHGATSESDIYFVSFTIPDFVIYLLAGGYFSITLIPLLARRFKRSEEEGWKFLSTVMTWVFIAGCLVIGIAFVFAPHLARIAAPGFTPQALERLTLFMRIILPGQLFFLLGFCLNARLYQLRQFIIPSIMPVLYNGIIIVCGLIWIDRGMIGFCWGASAGAFGAAFLLPLYSVLKSDGPRFRVSFSDPDLKKVILLSLPLMLGQSVVMVDEQLLRIFASYISEGAVSCISYARRLLFVPIGMVAQAAGVASFPFLAGLIAAGQRREFDRTINKTVKASVFLLIPISVWMIAAAEPIIRLIFEQGRFGQENTELTAHLMRILLLSLFCWGIHQVVARAFYANQNTITPAIIGSAATVAAIPVYYLAVHSLGATGIAAASAVFTGLYTLFLSYFWQRRYQGQALSGLGRTALLAALCCLPALAACLGASRLCADLWPQRRLLSALVEVLASGGAFVLVFAVPAWLLAPDLIRPMLDGLRRRWKR